MLYMESFFCTQYRTSEDFALYRNAHLIHVNSLTGRINKKEKGFLDLYLFFWMSCNDVDCFTSPRCNQ